MDYSFTFNGSRAKKLDVEKRKDLASSLEYLIEQITPIASFDEKVFQTIISNLRNAERYSSFLFALYTRIVYCLINQEYEKIKPLLLLFNKIEPLEKGRPSSVLLDSDMFFGKGNILADLMNIEDGTSFLIKSPSLSNVELFQKRLNRALGIIDKLLPEFSLEFNSLVSQVIMAEPDKNSGMCFDGGSSYMLWGGLFLNINSHESDIALIEVLVHESAHLLLYGFASEEPLTLNSSSELYSSPLREDKRPMEGIYHATYVSARMHLAMLKLLESKQLDVNSIIYAKKALLRNLCAFNDGYLVVKEYAKLSAIGKNVIKESYSYMRPYLLEGKLP